ncbi:MAG TPA: tRNA (adenosine(37)-N6)-threonylcarbamoyltransferase complex dimerization subunit type 1 TsaB [Niabella sp.]|nr:tRNA (adenosine(37)-N6)-threonylcarbamoyltransferase complex dimerization subunit type 1 TsaB [Niabella sp.]
MLILNIDTAINKGSFCISNNCDVLFFEINEKRNEQAGWLHHAIEVALQKAGLAPADLDAIAVSNGPGSYTGLRIGLASAKGLCYALKKPLICLNTLQVMAKAVQEEAADLICPMIDARRMEVFTAFYDKDLTIFKEPFAAELSEKSFSEILEKHQVIFTGNGSIKFQPLVTNTTARFADKNIDARDMVPLSTHFFKEKVFADVAYCEPYYVKDVYIVKK